MSFWGENEIFFNRYKNRSQKLSKSHYRNTLAIFLKTGYTIEAGGRGRRKRRKGGFRR